MPAKKKTEENEIKATTEEVLIATSVPEKPKRTRKKKTDTESSTKTPVSKPEKTKAKEIAEPIEAEENVVPERILTIDSKSKLSAENTEADIAWHEIQNAYITRRILTGPLSGIERTDNGKDIAIIDYYNYRIIIP